MVLENLHEGLVAMRSAVGPAHVKGKPPLAGSTNATKRERTTSRKRGRRSASPLHVDAATDVACTPAVPPLTMDVASCGAHDAALSAILQGEVSNSVCRTAVSWCASGGGVRLVVLSWW